MPARAERPALSKPPTAWSRLALVALALATLLAAPTADAARRRRRRRGRRAPHAQPAPQNSSPRDTSSAGPAVARDDERPPPAGGTSSTGANPATTSSTRASTSTSAAASDDNAPASRPAAIDVQITGGVLARHLSYSGDLYALYRPYDLDAAFAIGAALEWFPGAHVTAGAGAWAGLVASVDYAPGLSSRDPQGRSYATTAYAYAVGLKLRVPFGRSEVGVVAQYGAQVFSVESAQTSGSGGVPGVAYQFVRVGLAARVAFGERVALLVGAGVLPVLSTGEIGSAAYFPTANAFGAEGSLGLAVGLAGGVELRLEGFYRRFGLGVDGGGAADAYYGGVLGVGIRR